MLIWIAEGMTEVIMGEVKEGNKIGFDAYFTEGGRDVDCYDVEIAELPVQISTRVIVSPEQTYPERVH